MTPQTMALTLAAALFCGLAACSSNQANTATTPAPSKDPVTKPADTNAPRTYTGVLRSGIMAIGGESTGWMLEGADLERPVEVDVSMVAALAKKWEGYKIRITGTIITKKYVERGNVSILVANAIEPVM